MFDDVGKTIKAILYDRITSPLFGTFVLSWCGWNWRLIVLFLTDSSTTVTKKFQYLDAELYPSNGVTFIYGLLLPATTTAFFIYIYPWFARKVYGYWREQQNELKKLQVMKDGEKPLTKEEAQEIQSQALLSELRYQEEREKREARIRDLENLVKSLQPESALVPVKGSAKVEKSSTAPSQGKAYSPEVEDGMFSILKLLDRLAAGSYIDKDELIRATSQDDQLSKLDLTFLLHCLDNLSNERYIADSADSLLVLPKGRSALVNKHLDVE
jgi:hypothetical protein